MAVGGAAAGVLAAALRYHSADAGALLNAEVVFLLTPFESR
jgi:hypothetical protein